METVRQQAERRKTELTSLRRELHRCPELALREYETAAVIERELDKASVEHRRIGETGVLGILRGAGRRRSVAGGH